MFDDNDGVPVFTDAEEDLDPDEILRRKAAATSASIEAGRPITAPGPVSNMGRLDCKEPSHLALKYLAREADFFVTVSDSEAAETVDPGLSESLGTEKNEESDTIIVMFVSLRKKYSLTENLKKKIKLNIRKSLSPRHVPKIIIEVSDIPKTRNGKIVELMVKDIINNKEIFNKDSLSNPECLKDYYNRKKFKN